MTEKQIFKRLSRCYHNLFVTEYEDKFQDQWHGNPDDDPCKWHWFRPRDNTHYMLVLNTENNEVILYSCTDAEYKEKGIEAFKTKEVCKNRDYNFPCEDRNDEVGP